MNNDDMLLKPNGRTDPNSQQGESYTAMVPCRITVLPTKTFKDGTCQWLIFGSFIGASSREKPSLGTVRAATLREAQDKAQALINESYQYFINLRDNNP